MADENNFDLPLPPSLVRQVGQDLYVPPDLDTVIVPDGQDPLLNVNGAWMPRPNGLDGYTLEDFENIARNNGWYVDNFDLEDDETDNEEEEQEEEEERDVDPVFHDVM